MGCDRNSFSAARGLSGEEKLLISRIDDMIRLSEKTFSARFSGFLSEGEAALAESYLKYCNEKRYMLYGGYEGAQRVMLGIFPEYEEPCAEAFPIARLRFGGKMAGTLTHREYLGSIMALGIERSCTGDIVITADCAYAMLTETAGELASGMEKVGRAGVSCTYAPEDAVIRRSDSFEEISASVSSLRLDSVASAALKMSREKAAALIRSGAVSVNHTVTDSVSGTVCEGDVLSVRGHGRYIVDLTGGRTKKGRLHIIIKKYR